MKPSLLVCYDYEMSPWEVRVPYSPTYLLHQALKEFFDTYIIGEKEGHEVDFVLNMLPLGQDNRQYRVGKKTLFWNITPLEGLMKEVSQSADIVFCAVPSLTDQYGKKGKTLLHALNPAYKEYPEEKVFDVGFLGSEIEGSRIDFLNKIEERFSLIRGATLLGEPSARALSACRLVLSIEDWNQHEAGIEHRFWTFGNVRPILMYKTKDLALAGFTDGVHYIGYQNLEDCMNKIEEWLDKPDLAESIGDNLKRELSRSHTYRHRAKEVYKLCKQI